MGLGLGLGGGLGLGYRVVRVRARVSCWNSPNEMKPSPFLSKERKRSRELDLRAAHCLLTCRGHGGA